jgi:hypothetical protein
MTTFIVQFQYHKVKVAPVLFLTELQAFLTLALDGGEWSALLSGKEPLIPIG